MTLDNIRHIRTDCTVAYARLVVDCWAQKKDPNRVCITVGGNLIEYPHDLTIRTAELMATNMMWNSIISTRDARYMCANIKNFYLCTPLDQYEYMRRPVNLFP